MLLYKIIIFINILAYAWSVSCDSHYYQKDGFCQQCDIKCSQCAMTATNCSSCQQKYYLQNNSSCQTCPSICSSCTSNNVCTGCQQGYYLLGSRCTSCTGNCAICNQTSNCTVCKVGYEISSNCRNCSQGFYWNQTRKICDRCSLGCNQCISTLYCQSCGNQYTYKDGICNYNGNFQSQDEKPKDPIGIIVGIILGGIFLIIIILYVASRTCLKKQKKRVKGKGKGKPSISNLIQQQSQSQVIDQEISSHNIKACVICSKINADRGFDCGHIYHMGCMEENTEKACPLCLRNEDKEIYLDQVMNSSEIQNNSQLNSQTTSQQPNQAYIQSSMRDSQMMDNNIIQIEDD